MKNRIFIHIVISGVFLILIEQMLGLNTVFGLSLIGPPRSLLQPEQSAFAVELSYNEMDLESFGERTEIHISPYSSDIQYRKYNIENMKSIIPSLRLDTNVNEDWDIFLRLGVTDAACDITEEQAGGTAGRKLKDFDGGFGLSWGVGTRTTFYEQDNTTWGATFQANWSNPGDSDITDESDANFKGTAELNYWEVQLAIGPTVEFENIRVYGGPFLHFVNGDLELSGSTLDPSPVVMTIDASPEIKEKSQIGGFLGAQWNLGNKSTLITETQFTGDALGIGISLTWKY
ncbi:MAG: hypothetical protein JXA96_07540 [Sedimentisphaerales bacterium]|nr:hypothetical protein [Sedimentisphaerales bacterium]